MCCASWGLWVSLWTTITLARATHHPDGSDLQVVLPTDVHGRHLQVGQLVSHHAEEVLDRRVRQPDAGGHLDQVRRVTGGVHEEQVEGGRLVVAVVPDGLDLLVEDLAAGGVELPRARDAVRPEAGDDGAAEVEREAVRDGLARAVAHDGEARQSVRGDPSRRGRGHHGVLAVVLVVAGLGRVVAGREQIGHVDGEVRRDVVHRFHRQQRAGVDPVVVVVDGPLGRRGAGAGRGRRDGGLALLRLAGLNGAEGGQATNGEQCDDAEATADVAHLAGLPG